MDDLHTACLLYTRRGKGRTLALRLGIRFSHACSVLGDWSGCRKRDGPFRRRGVIPTENQRPLASVASPCVIQECAAGRIPFHAAWVQTASAWTFRRNPMECENLRQSPASPSGPSWTAFPARDDAAASGRNSRAGTGRAAVTRVLHHRRNRRMRPGSTPA